MISDYRSDAGLNITMKHTNIQTGVRPMAEYKKPGAVDHLRETDNASKAVQKTKYRISLDFIEGHIGYEEELSSPKTSPQMTVIAITLKNGFVVIGKSAPADKLNFNKELGRRFAREDCIRQLWPLFAFALREHLQKTIDFEELEEPPNA